MEDDIHTGPMQNSLIGIKMDFGFNKDYNGTVNYDFKRIISENMRIFNLVDE